MRLSGLARQNRAVDVLADEPRAPTHFDETRHVYYLAAFFFPLA